MPWNDRAPWEWPVASGPGITFRVDELRRAAERSTIAKSYRDYVLTNYPNLARELPSLATLAPSPVWGKMTALGLAGGASPARLEKMSQKKETNMAGIKIVKPKPLKSRASTETLLVKLLAAIKATYPTQPGQLSPGLVFSDLSPENIQYGSICTYEPLSNVKKIRYSAKRATIREVLIDLSRQLVGNELSTARQELAKAVK